jgi:hypothetical protein
MARAEKQATRNKEIRDARVTGESVRSIAERFELSETRVREVLRSAAEPLEGNQAAHQRALAHVDEFNQYKEAIRRLAEEIPVTQAAAKVGAVKAWGEAVQKSVALEQQLGLLPIDLAELDLDRDMDMTSKRVMQLLKQYKVPGEVRDHLLQALRGEPV